MAEIDNVLSLIEAAVADKRLTDNAAENVRTWLTEPHFEEYVPQVVEHVTSAKWKELEDAFWTTIPFGTGGRRGRMYPIGCNAINDRTIGESAQGLADYVKEQFQGKPLSCAIAYDTRHRSRHFAELCSEIMAAAGFDVYFLDGHRSTPELSFAVRYKDCTCGIMITASHNPPADNAVKVYWSTGGQLLPPYDGESIDRMKNVTYIKRTGFAQAREEGKIVYCQEEVDEAFFEAVTAQSHEGPRDVKIIYSPLHGVGGSAVPDVLKTAGFTDVEIFGPHAAPDPDFPNVPNHSANPENAAVFDIIIDRAKETGAELIMATDPDCDRLGCAVPKTLDPGAPWVALTGNQIGSLLADYLLSREQADGTLTSDHYVVKTLVTTELMRRIADGYGAKTFGNLLVGFKWIGGTMDDQGPDKFVFGAEESYGFLTGQYARDKDGAVAAMLLAELAAKLKAEGRSLCQQLDSLFTQHGCHAEKTVSVQMPGEKGMDDMKALMARFRTSPPESIAGMDVARARDYLNNTIIQRGTKPQPLDGPTGDLVILDLASPGNYVAVRPSGTEPKVKFYMFTCDPPESITDLETTRATLAARLEAMEADLKAC